MAKILLVEDDIMLAQNLKRFLVTEGFDVVHASGQAEGIRAFEESLYDCVLLDISLGDGNGFSVCESIKSVSDVPVIFLTASADESCTVAGFEVGADDYISKPFRSRELIARIKNAMRKNSSVTSTISCGGVTIFPAKGIVMKNGSEVYLSALEYRLLMVFFTNKEILLTRDRLVQELWSVSGEFVSDNTLNVYMKRLREKIEDNPQQPSIIITVRGRGYKAVD